MSFEDTIEEHEHRLWEALRLQQTAVAHFDEYLTKDARMAIPDGVFDRAGIFDLLEHPRLIIKYEMRSPHVMRLSEDSALIIYEITVDRHGDDPFHAAVCTVYVNQDGRARMASHQMTPLGW